jgi:hypothetical protein
MLSLPGTQQDLPQGMTSFFHSRIILNDNTILRVNHHFPAPCYPFLDFSLVFPPPAGKAFKDSLFSGCNMHNLHTRYRSLAAGKYCLDPLTSTVNLAAIQASISIPIP